MKFHSSDQRYLEARKALSDQAGPREMWSLVDHWPLYVGIGNLSRWVAILDLVRSTRSVPGHLAEFGSWRGANLMFMAKLLRIIDPHGQKVVHSFDTFEGLAAFSPEDGVGQEMAGRYKGSLEELQALIGLYELDDDIAFHIGLIEETLPKLMAERPELTFSFVYCDTDLYESTSVVLEHVPARMHRGALLVFDEWNDESFPGEGLAANEFLAREADAWDVLAVEGARQPSLVLRKR